MRDEYIYRERVRKTEGMGEEHQEIVAVERLIDRERDRDK